MTTDLESNSDAGRTPILPLLKDRSFWGLLCTQFLGAFNDNLFKQLVLLSCIDLVAKKGGDLQGVAGAIFTAPFLFLSGWAGYLSDRYSKTSIIRWCKLAEIGIALAGMIAFRYQSVPFLMVVLGFMGIHSAFFGPPKYGILPELFLKEDLPRANGLILMTTFLAIILGIASAGAVKDLFPGNLWLASGLSLIVAAMGLAASFAIRALPSAAPQMSWKWSALLIDHETRAMLWQRTDLLKVLLVYSTFWLVAGLVYPPAINDVAKRQMNLSDSHASLLAASTGLGIGVGCLLAGMLCRKVIRGSLVTWGALGITLSLFCAGLPGPRAGNTLVGSEGLAVALVSLGACAGCFSVPLQVYLQSQSPEGYKGRMIAAMNLLNFTGIFVASALYFSISQIWQQLQAPFSTTFFVAGALMLLVPLCYRPPTLVLKD